MEDVFTKLNETGVRTRGFSVWTCHGRSGFGRLFVMMLGSADEPCPVVRGPVLTVCAEGDGTGAHCSVA